MSPGRGPATVVLISGNGTNLQAIIDAVRADSVGVSLTAVVSDNPDAYGLERARQADVPTVLVNYQDYSERTEFDRSLGAELERLAPQLVVLAGFMRILPDALVDQYRGRMLNIHPSLLPKYPGLDTYRRVLKSSDRWHGSTVHFVTPELDAGPAVIQYRVRISDSETEASLSARVQTGEYIIYPRAIGWLAAQRIALDGDTVLFDGDPLDDPVLVHEDG